MKPWLLCLNLNGMDPAGDQRGRKILPLAVGSEDSRLLRLVRESGYQGPVGILNHTGEDAEARLLDNLDGLAAVVHAVDHDTTPVKPAYRSWRATPAPPAPPAPSAPGQPAAAPAGAATAVATGVPSLSPAFGKALLGAQFADGGAAFRTLPLTVECRAKLHAKQRFNILVACDRKSSAEHWELYTYAQSGFLSLYMPGRGGNITAPVDVCDDRWHTLAAVIEPHTARLYVDGKLVKEAPVAALKGQPVPGGLAIGSLVEGNLRCDGILDDVRISSGVREPVAPEAAPLPRDAHTLGLWTFDDLPEKPATTVPEKPSAAAPEIPRSALPAAHIIPAAPPETLTPTNGWSLRGTQRDWTRSLGGGTSNRFSELRQITPENVASLREAWTYRSGDGRGNVQCNPVVVGGVMYIPTPGQHVVAVDAKNGAERWRFSPVKLTGDARGTPARRGLVYWPGDAHSPARLLFGHGGWLIALDAATGEPVSTFGNGGKASVPTGTTVAGAAFEDVFVIAGYQADVFGFDIRSGRELWRFKTRPEPGEPGSETWAGAGSGANCWGGIAMDESRGIAYVATGSPKPNFFGMGHKGDNLFSNCVIALDARTGKRLWHFQEVRHDIWDWDIPAPPNLVTVERHGRRVDAVAQVTKLGNTLLLDRVTGQPLYDFKLVKTDGKALPGDVTAVYQPQPEIPQPFARQAYTMADAPVEPAARAFVLPTLERANLGAFPSLEEAKPTVLFNIHGGAEWTGAAADAGGFLYVTSNEIPWAITTFRDDDPEPLKPPTRGEQVYQQLCAVCHGPDRKGVGHAPPLRGARHRLDEAAIRALLKTGRSTMPPMPFLKEEEEVRPLVDFVLCRDRGNAVASGPKGPAAWTFSGFKKLLDGAGYPACTPPWGSLVCLNLNTGRIAWSVPFGEYSELTAKGVPVTGQENFGGATVTASGVVFATGTRDGMLRAYAAATGRELWRHALPFSGTAAPSVYEVDGRQHVVVTATGGGKLGTTGGDAWVAFALPEGGLGK
jgi:quinoprotein glucose dehydrogenase